MSESFTKLFSSILRSTIWQEPPETKVVWITMLAMCDRNGYVGASIPGLAAAAGVSIPSCEAAIEKFLAPDRYSRSREHEGRRIEVADRGWNILNYKKFRELRDEEARREWDRQRKRAQRATDAVHPEGGHVQNVRQSPPESAHADAYAVWIDGWIARARENSDADDSGSVPLAPPPPLAPSETVIELDPKAEALDGCMRCFQIGDLMSHDDRRRIAKAASEAGCDGPWFVERMNELIAAGKSEKQWRGIMFRMLKKPKQYLPMQRKPREGDNA